MTSREPYFRAFFDGRPVPQGSMTPYARGRKIRGRFEPFRTPDGRLVLGVKASNEAVLKSWRAHMTGIARSICTATRGFVTIDEPVNLAAVFVFPRNVSDMGTGRNAGVVKASAPPWPTTGAQGDISKLVRACEDSLTDAGIWQDDRLVVSYDGTRKRWAVDGEPPGVHVTVTRADLDDVSA